ncbi:MAG: peptide-methionine (S)-S-oxide reductase MsrA [Bacteroidia bacterium]|nr:peptide-methionine (S)-S-oxide reductase MsrA [Bacteroidia bacterium]
MKLSITGIVFSFVFLIACTSVSAEKTGDNLNVPKITQSQLDSMNLKKAYFASGCFWCVEAIFESVEGVHEAVSGYSGGYVKNPTYQQVSAKRTGHAETVEVYYDPEVVSYETLVKVYYGSHDPTTKNRQGPDVGTPYRSVIFYQKNEEKKIITDYITYLESEGGYNKGDIVTEVVPLDVFYRAEEYHQDFEKRNPNYGYVKAVSIPRLRRFQKKYPELLKKGH